VSWRTVHASTVGTSHLARGQDCDDDCWANVDNVTGRPPTLSVFVSDGAGSALRGGDGARLAIQTAASFLGDKLAQAEFGLGDQFAVELVMAVRAKIYAHAAQAGLRARDFACTFLGLVSSYQGTLAFQVGDGGIALDVGSGLEVPIQPMQGEFANMTNFVTDENALDVLQSRMYGTQATRVAAFSDGLQRLALNMATNTPHEPFFARFFDVLGASRQEQDDQMQAALVSFLNSDQVNERTDDDKSLALAILPG
jgi:Protein phosphatase 2C